MASDYLCELVSNRMSSRKLRSTGQMLLVLGASHMVIVHLVLQPPLCGIGSWQILEIRRLFKQIIRFKTHLSGLLFHINNTYLLNHLEGFYRHIIWGTIILYIICTAPLNGSC